MNQNNTDYWVLAIQHKFDLRLHLPKAWRAARTWTQTRPGGVRIPIPPACVSLLAAPALSRGMGRDEFDRILWVSRVVLWQVAPAALLRPGEVAQILRRGIAFPAGVASSHPYAIILRQFCLLKAYS